MLNFYKIVKENLSFNRFEFENTVCLEYTCPIEADQIGIFSKSDYLVHVLSGKKTYKTVDGEWTLTPGQTLYLRKGAEIIYQDFDDEYCMLGFFLSDDLITETHQEVQGKIPLKYSKEKLDFSVVEIDTSEFLEGYFHSMLNYFRGINRPGDHIMVLKLKELLLNLMESSDILTTYFKGLGENNRTPIQQVMEKNYCFNLKLENYAELCHCSLSTFKREFASLYQESPGKWLIKKRVNHAANLLVNTDMSVSQVAFESGFEDLSHFSRAFKTKMGQTPKEYRLAAV